jgi:hypothetical protein
MNQGPSGDYLMKKLEGRKSRDTVRLSVKLTNVSLTPKYLKFPRGVLLVLSGIHAI